VNGVHSGTRDVHDLIFGPVDPRDPPALPLVVVNPAESAPTGWGAPNVQQFQSGHTNNLITNEAAEQGYGVGPERQWAHYPHAVNPNPYRRMGAFLRDGGDTYSTDIYRPEVVAYWANALAHEAAATPVKHAMRPDPVVNQPPSQPYVQTVASISPGGYFQ
jgi:hypothetical protein